MTESTKGRPRMAPCDFDPRDKIAYTVAQAAEATGLSEPTIWRRIQAGELWTFKWGGRTLILADVLKAAVLKAAREQAPVGAEIPEVAA